MSILLLKYQGLSDLQLRAKVDELISANKLTDQNGKISVDALRRLAQSQAELTPEHGKTTCVLLVVIVAFVVGYAAALLVEWALAYVSVYPKQRIISNGTSLFIDQLVDELASI